MIRGKTLPIFLLKIEQILSVWLQYALCSPVYFLSYPLQCINMNRATSWENIFMPYTNNKGIDQPAHPHILISMDAQADQQLCFHCPDSIIPLNSVSSQCTRGKSSTARKSIDHPKIFKWSRTFQQCNLPDFKFYPSKLTNKTFSHMV